MSSVTLRKAFTVGECKPAYRFFEQIEMLRSTRIDFVCLCAEEVAPYKLEHVIKVALDAEKWKILIS